MRIEKYSIGIGDRFGHQGVAQLSALVRARTEGVDVVPVWNKSNREHMLIGTNPATTRREADHAVETLGWTASYFVDADHIGLKTVEPFLEASDYFTLDVADFIGKTPDDGDLAEFVKKWSHYAGNLKVPGIDEGLQVTKEAIAAVGRKYLVAVKEAGRIYRHVESRKGKENFVTEVSMDETDSPQTPTELFFILGALAGEGVPLQTIAPKFSGEFLKGVDYVGDVRRFEREFEQDLAVIAFAVREFSLPANLKISVHSGSDKFSIYPVINRAIAKFDAGLHLKTAGTTWLEEVIGLAKTGGDGLQIAKDVYAQAYARFDELAKPYATVIDIDRKALPDPAAVKGWSAAEYVAALTHDPKCTRYNRSFRQLVHIGFKVAAEMKERYLDALVASEEEIGCGVANNIYERHLRPLFLG